MTLKDLKKHVKYAREQGLTSLKISGVEFSIHPAALFPESKKNKTGEDDKAPETDALTEEDVLMWSVAGSPMHNEAN